jgi:hypothetical protein
MDFNAVVGSAGGLMIRQRKELAELFGFETRNKFSIETADGQAVGFCAEQQKGIIGFFFRQALGHWRRFELLFFNNDRQPVLRAVHPFRWWFQRLEVYDADGRLLGALQLRFALLSKRFDLEDGTGRILMTVNSPLWKLWTFPFIKAGQEAAVVRKKWSGLLKESFLDADNFFVEYTDKALPLPERKVVLAAAFFIDLQYFEKKAR